MRSIAGWIGWTELGKGRGLAVLAVALFCVGVAARAEAEVRRVEAIGIYGIRDAMRTKVIPRDEAIADARWEGVSRVALELIGESAPVGFDDDALDGRSTIEAPLESEGGGRPDPNDVRLGRETPSEDQARRLVEALGEDMLPYTRSYRIVEDQGERPVLFDDSPGVDSEYVVVVEVIVDVDRVGRALETAGLVVAEEGATQLALTLEVVGLSRYEALEQVLAALRGPLGATRVTPVEFERDRQLLAVEGPFDADGLAGRLSRFEDPRLVLEPVALDSVYRRVRVLARWFPPIEAGESAESGPSGASGR